MTPESSKPGAPYFFTAAEIKSMFWLGGLAGGFVGCLIGFALGHVLGRAQ